MDSFQTINRLILDFTIGTWHSLGTVMDSHLLVTSEGIKYHSSEGVALVLFPERIQLLLMGLSCTLGMLGVYKMRLLIVCNSEDFLC